MTPVPAGLRVGLPSPKSRVFHGDRNAQAAFETAEKIAAGLGATLIEIDLAPFFEAARLLYEGPWIAERAAAVGEFIAKHPSDVHPVTRAIISQGSQPSAVDAFRGMYRLAELSAVGRAAFAGIDALMVPTVPFAPTVAQVEADPVGLNMQLGTYTNFVNLMDLAAVAVPAVIAGDGTPYGVTFLAPAGCDAELASLGAAFHARTSLKLGALDATLPAFEPRPSPGSAEIAVAVVGAHLSGMPLNHELRSLGARLIEATTTAPDYRLFALATAPPRPGMLRVAAGTGSPIELEVWSLRPEAFGAFVAAVAAPLSIGTVRLADGRTVKGFLVEAEGVADAREISSFGGWRKYVASGN
jgi:allophanate hydrolase